MWEILDEIRRLEIISQHPDIDGDWQEARDHLTRWKTGMNWESTKFNPKYHGNPWYGLENGSLDYVPGRHY